LPDAWPKASRFNLVVTDGFNGEQKCPSKGGQIY
jgi:hypothetical protein